MSLRFGTDGWRAVIADAFTFANVRRVTAGIARAMKDAAGAASEAPVVIGYDTRFLSGRFAETAAETLLGEGFRVLLASGPCPTPAASCQVVATGSPYAIVITASHNPAVFNGVKIKDNTGASASSEVTDACERAIPPAEPKRASLEEGLARGAIERRSFRPAHVDRLAAMVDLPALRSAGLRIVFDPMHGSAADLLESLLAGGTTRVDTLHANPDPLFGGRHPEPREESLDELRRRVLSSGADAGFATDGDGDRIGAFDEKGRFISPLRIAPLIAWNLIKKGRRGPIGKTFANTLLLDRIARHFGLPFAIFPVGFKHIARELQRGRMLLGGEESGGIGVEGYIPERDGILISLMLLQAMIDEGRTLSEMVADLSRRFGELHYRRRDIPCDPDRGRALVEALASRLPDSLGGMRVTGHDDRDGLKLLFGDEGWILFRPSGTEPVLRVYSEAPTPRHLEAAMNDGIAWIESLGSPQGS